jgi:hypothetical protein
MTKIVIRGEKTVQPDNRFLDDLTETSDRVEPARVVADADAESWDAACDVLVVGVGLAGVCAALRTAEPGEVLVPRAPSALIMDVAKAVIGDRDIEIKVTGIRPGEKIHEIMISEEESFRTVARGDFYAIRPMLPELDNGYDGKPAMFDALQTFENPALRPFLKVERGIDGIIVTQTDAGDASYPLKPWDVITTIGDTPIDNEKRFRIQLDYDLSQV